MSRNIEMIRGDTAGFYFQRIDAEGEVITTQPESLYFTVKKNFNTIPFVLQKKLEDMRMDEEGTWHFTIEPEDTEELSYKTYVYDIQVVQDGVKTTIAKGGFAIKEEVTFIENED